MKAIPSRKVAALFPGPHVTPSLPTPTPQVKFEQDVEIRRQEAAAARAYQFRANPVPPTSLEPRYEEMLLRQEVQRQVNHDTRLQELARWGGRIACT